MNAGMNISLFLMIHALIITPLLMGLAFDRKSQRDERGRLNFRKDGFILRRLYVSCDIWIMLGVDERKMPSNICQLYWGIFWGTLRFPFALAFYVFGIAVAKIFKVPLFFMIMFLGFWPREARQDERSAFKFGTARIRFYGYKKYGNGEKEKFLFTPWELTLVLLAPWLATHTTAFFIQNSQEFKAFGAFLLILSSSIGAIALIYLLADMTDRYIALPINEFVKAKKAKACFKINVH